ncbi:MAG: ribonuclease HI [Pseudomonadota bacterium]|nr:ribonuclease HI [Pseudomonadota bacterium]
MSDSSDQIVIYTDGACLGNPGPGGWGALLQLGQHEKILQGNEADTTNNRMELQAAISALSALKRPAKVILYTDSKYLKSGMTQWVQGWQQRGWKSANRQPVKNKDLWLQLVALDSQHTISWRWVKGHSGDPLNERVDSIAHEAALAVQKQDKEDL